MSLFGRFFLEPFPTALDKMVAGLQTPAVFEIF